MGKNHAKLESNGTDTVRWDFCCISYRFVDFLTLITLTQLYFKKPTHISDQYCFEKLPNN